MFFQIHILFSLAVVKLFKHSNLLTLEHYSVNRSVQLSVLQKLNMFEKIHLQFCKRILKLKSSTLNFMIYGELGRFPINIYVIKRMIAFWLKLAVLYVL